MKNFLKRAWKFSLKCACWFVAISVAWVLMYKWVNPPTTVLQLLEGKDHDRHWVDMDEMSQKMALAVVASEDQRFPEHWGFDTEAIAKAIEYNKTHSKTRGASTISQQCAKNVFLWPSRSWVRKGMEVWFTALIELFWSKERIMEVYLNVIEMGPQTFGVEAAGQKYFNVSATKLTSAQAALIAGGLPSPKKSNPGKPSNYLRKRGQQIQKQMRQLGGVAYLPWSESKD
ncbi:MAG: monofunctional biosynthetic peptidoglycan transglycosylase [Flavobacteriales bacterium]|nr:monofunctional biosynthetic peptidoglycan transglycosylase [Flavobacteriales bacterium]MDG1780690.1 monofunctional biosynthetic peptidoglycan transglycosylase [Flavobacteriales bacterium]MDG2244899.1 monofunctional biosynthetic peptidoglycan transglycosylase [Flavobacteriales bacterium]